MHFRAANDDYSGNWLLQDYTCQGRTRWLSDTEAWVFNLVTFYNEQVKYDQVDFLYTIYVQELQVELLDTTIDHPHYHHPYVLILLQRFASLYSDIHTGRLNNYMWYSFGHFDYDVSVRIDLSTSRSLWQGCVLR